MSSLSLKVLAVFAALTLTMNSAYPQHRHGHDHVIRHNGHLDIVHHHGRHFGHNNWNYVVPHYDTYRHRGSYYVQNQVYYYTPTPIVRIASPTIQSVALPPAPVVQNPVQLQFGGYARTEDLAGRLETEVNRLCLDMHYNYQHNPGFAEAYREAYGLLQSAKFVHTKEHQGDRESIRHHVSQMDQVMHHLLDEIRPWSRYSNRQIASGGLIEKSSAVEAILHHLCYDVGVEPHGDDEPAPPPAEELAPPPPAPVGAVSPSPAS